MRILFFGKFDWANISHRISRAINTSGLGQARVLVERAHPSGYEEDMVVERRTHGAFRQIFDAADWIITTGDASYEYFMSTVALLAPLRARLATCHVGTAYRDAHEHLNEVDKKIGFTRRFIGGDLFRFAVDDPSAVPYFAPPHGVAWELRPIGARVRIGHSPTHRETKGTAAILQALEGLDADVDLIEKVSFEECARRRAACDIFIDQFNPEIGGYGASAVEALAAGCAVLASTRNIDSQVHQFYPPPPIGCLEDQEQLRRTLELYLRDRALLEDQRWRSLAWARAHATPNAIASYWLGHLQ